MDPFAGSMTAAIASRKLNRNWICVERDEKIFDDAVLVLRSGPPRKR
jgi:DNA modification methylase